MTFKEAKLIPAKRKHLMKALGPTLIGYTTKELEQFLDLLYGMFSHAYTLHEINQIVASDPFDRIDPPRQLKLVEFTDWLESLVF